MIWLCGWDVSRLVDHCRSTRQSFFINYLYLALRELNAIPEFKMRVHDGRPYIYDKVDCSFTVANEYGYFVNRTAETADYKVFYEAVAETISKAKKEKNIHPETSDLCRTDLLLCHSMDWLRVHDVACNYESIRFWQYSLFVGWGKYVSEGDRCRMSMHMKISHAFIYGKPLTDAFNNIQTALDELDFWVD